MTVRPRVFARHLGVLALVLLVQLVLAGAAFGAITSVPDSPLVTNGPVFAFATQGNMLYVGGAFDRIGPRSGPFASVSASTGSLDSGLPQVSGGDGEVDAVAADGSGGWFIGGDFTHVGGISRVNLAHVLADGSVDPSFHPDPSDFVEDLALSGSTLYVAGGFSSIGGQSRASLAALDSTTGIPTSWQADADNPVNKIALSGDGSTLYAMGNFATIGANSASRAGLAAIDTGTGDANAWDPHPTSTDSVFLDSLAVSGSTVYVGGAFDHIGHTPVARNGLAALSATGSGDATTWDPNPTATDFTEIEALAVSGSTVYVGGFFDHIGQSTSQPRTNLAAVDATSGDATSWRPDPNDGVQAMAVAGSSVYVAGNFDHVGQSTSVARHGAAAIDSSSGDPTGWDPAPNALGAVFELVPAAGHIALAGEFSAFGGDARPGLAAIDLTTGTVTPFNADLTADSGGVSVDALAVSGSTLYAGGNFDHVGQAARPFERLAAFNALSGDPLEWAPHPNDGVSSLAVIGGQVYAGGAFTQIGANSAARSGLAELDPLTASASSWHPDPGPNGVEALLASGSTLYVVGAFTSIAGSTRHSAAAFDGSTGALLPWAPDADGHVDALAVDGSRVYLAGVFSNINGEPRHSLAAVDATTGALNGWAPTADNADAIAVTGGVVYTGGQSWDSVVPPGLNGVPRNGLGAVDASSGALLAWDPNLGTGSPEVIAAGPPGTLFVGGFFGTTALAPNSDLALFGVPTGTTTGGGGGGGGGAGTGNPPPAAKPTKPRVRVSVRHVQRIVHQHGGLIVSAVSSQAGTLRFSATVSVPKLSRVLRFKGVRKTVRANKRVKVKLKLSKKSLKLVRRALAHHKKLRAKVRVVDTSRAHLSSSKSVTVRLKR